MLRFFNFSLRLMPKSQVISHSCAFSKSTSEIKRFFVHKICEFGLNTLFLQIISYCKWKSGLTRRI